jgi:translation initiation factor eIF-2B subunit gamma
MDMVHVDVEQQAQSSSALRVHIVQPGNYCARVADVASYGDVNREVLSSPTEGVTATDCLLTAAVHPGTALSCVHSQVADSSIALHLAGLRPSVQHDNVVPASTVTGSKTTIAAGCVLGEGCVLGDKASIKRSVLGNNVK